MSSSSSSDKSKANALATYKWEIANFASFTKTTASATFCPPNNARGIYFHLFINPKLSTYQSNRIHTVIGFGLICGNSVQFPLSVQYRLSILGANGEKHHTRDLSTEFVNKDSVDTQYNLNWFYLTNPASRLLVNGKLNIYCEAYLLDTVDCCKSNPPTLDTKMSQDYGSLLENSKFADVTLVVGEKAFKAHKLVLAARSPVFCAMFEHADTKESQENRVEIQDISVEVFEQLIRFIYTGKVDSLDQYAVELLQAADRYQLDSLKCTCEQYLGSSLTIESFASIAVLADVHCANKLEKQCIDYFVKHTDHVIKTDGWKKLIEPRPKLACQLIQFVIDKMCNCLCCKRSF